MIFSYSVSRRHLLTGSLTFLLVFCVVYIMLWSLLVLSAVKCLQIGLLFSFANSLTLFMLWSTSSRHPNIHFNIHFFSCWFVSSNLSSSVSLKNFNLSLVVPFLSMMCIAVLHFLIVYHIPQQSCLPVPECFCQCIYLSIFPLCIVQLTFILLFTFYLWSWSCRYSFLPLFSCFFFLFLHASLDLIVFFYLNTLSVVFFIVWRSYYELFIY